MQKDSQSSDCLSSAAKDVSIHLLCFGQAFFFCFPTFQRCCAMFVICLLPSGYTVRSVANIFVSFVKVLMKHYLECV